MIKENKIYIGLKPIVHTLVFEMKKQKKKFIFFLIISIFIVFLQGVILQVTIPFNLLSDTQAEFFSSGLGFYSLISLFTACLLFSGIICSEFSTKTGFIVFPKINKYKLIIGSYLGNLVLAVIIISAYYFFLGLLGFYYYGGPINVRFFYSYFIAILYMITLSSFVTLFSSFMKSVNMTIISTILILLIGFQIADSIVTLVGGGNIEPLYSIAYMGNLITSILSNPFPDPRYFEMTMRNFTIGMWLTPSIEMGITLMVVFIIAYFVIAALLFKRRQL
jgi:ABC-type transport system involved in multi-copper enzyme maturation permease subunit